MQRSTSYLVRRTLPHSKFQARMARGIHGLTKVSLGPALPYPSMPCRRATPETALWMFLGWPAHRAGDLRPSSTPLDTPQHMGLPNSIVGVATARVGCESQIEVLV
jgi:hypothetical protein